MSSAAATAETLRLAEVVRLADAVEKAARDVLGGADTFGDRCRRCGLGSCGHLREALRAYRDRREALEAAP